MWLPEDVQNAASLLDKCDRKILHLVAGDLGSAEIMDKEIAAQILYGGIRNPKVLDHIQELITSENQV